MFFVKIVLSLLLFCFFVSDYNYKIAYGNEYTSAIVVDASNGEVLYSKSPDLKIFPASLTKMMTAYIIFDMISKDVIGLNDDVNVKLNNVSKQYKISDLLYKLAVNSNNSAANILAKEVYGNVDDFVLKMNEYADKMNMRKTHFANTNGLHNENNYSTARDMAKLSIRLVYDFPQYADFFGTTNYINEDGEYSTKTSKIQDSINGIEGGKTGYLSSSGYNLTAWGKYNNRHLFVVVIGADNKINRDALVLKLINFALKNSNIVLEKKLTKNSSFEDKIFNFIGIDYSKYIAPHPLERNKRRNFTTSSQTADNVDAEEHITDEKPTNKQKISYFYKK